MGRRKIEIQPITHERNRSVTFLKRKNGLFKKAYELGVLCSVDVAVIIFEERAGHHLKLYQYCSGDIHDIVQRHIRYDGEKDTRTPHDFANNSNAKLDDAGDGDDDDVDDDDPDSNPRNGSKKRTDTKLRQEYGNNGKLAPPSGGDLGLNADMNEYPLHRPMTIPQPPMPLHHSTQLPSPSGASSLPISTERHTSSGRLLPTNNQLSSQKKPRLAPNVSAGSNPKLTPDDSMYNSYHPAPSAHPPNNYRQNGQTSHPLSYNYLGVATSSPQQPYLSSSSFEFPSSSRGAQIPRTTGYNPRSSTAYPQHQDPQLQGIYHQLMRPPGQPPNSSNSRSQQSPDLLSAFLDNGDDHRPPPTQPSQIAPLDWPSHAPPQPQGLPPPQQESAHSGETNWLDFLSHNAPQSGGQQLHMALPPANGRDGLPWERDRNMEHYAPSERGGIIDRSMMNGTGIISPTSRKRPRGDSSVDDGRRPSPTARSKIGVGHDGPNGDPHGPGIKEE